MLYGPTYLSPDGKFSSGVEYMDQNHKRKIQSCAIAGALCLIVTFSYAFTLEEESRLKSLRNLAAIRVQVSDFSADFKAEFKKAGLTESLLETMVERRLEDAGIKVLQEFESDKSDQTATLQISVQAHSPISARKFTMTGDGIDFSAPGGQPAYLYLIRIALRQKASLLREPSVELTVATWSADTFGIRRLRRLPEVIDDQVDQFINAYRSENR